MAAKFDQNDDSVVVIVGSGAGGGTLGNELAQKGVKVVVLEAGKRFDFSGFHQRRMGELRPARLDGYAHDLRQLAGSQELPQPAGLDRQVGRRNDDPLGRRFAPLPGARVQGRVDLWPRPRRQSSRLAADARRPRALLRQGRGQDAASPAPATGRACRATTISRSSRRAPTSSATRSVIPAGWRSTPLPATAAVACQQTGFCFQGCKWGAKWSTLYTEIPKGEATGNLEVRPESHVAQIEHDASGKVTGVTYFDADGKLQRQKARIVAVAGNSLESPRLLLNSASSKFPDGLANSSGQVGRNYMRHTTGSVYGVFEQPVHMYRGTTMAGIVRDEARNDPSRGFVGGYELETLSLGLPFMAAFLDPGAWGREFTTAIDGYSNMAGMWIVGEDMPQETNRITLSDQKDKWGLPVVDVHFDDHPNDVAMRNHAYGQGKAMYEAVGATRTFPTPPYPSTHNLGTNRMSDNARDGVVNNHGPDARHQEPVHLGRQPVHHRRRREPDPDDRDPRDPSGRLHRRPDEVEHDLRGTDAKS